jgi:hypothetical protein
LRPAPAALLLALALVGRAAPARADAVEACIRAADEGQSLRDQGRLLAARERFVTCAAEACPALLRDDCAGWLGGLEARLPSVVIAAADPAGRDLVDARVSIDGAPRPDAAAGRAVPLDPGVHAVRVTGPGGAVVELTVLLREGERRRVVAARFAAAGAAAPPGPAGRGPIIAAVVLGGVALTGGGLFAGLAWSAKDELAHLRATCAPGCDPAAVDAVRAREIGANVALGVGLAAALAGTLVVVLRPGAGAKAAWLGAEPRIGGAVLGAGLRF